MGGAIAVKKNSHITIFNRGSCTTSIIKWISHSRGETYMMCILIYSTLPLSDRIFIFEQTASALDISNLGHQFHLNVSTVTRLKKHKENFEKYFLVNTNSLSPNETKINLMLAMNCTMGTKYVFNVGKGNSVNILLWHHSTDVLLSPNTGPT